MYRKFVPQSIIGLESMINRTLLSVFLLLFSKQWTELKAKAVPLDKIIGKATPLSACCEWYSFLKVDVIGFCANFVTKSKISSIDTNCAPLVADLFLFCYDRDFMTSLSDDSQADIIEAFDTTLDIWTIFLYGQSLFRMNGHPNIST